MAMIGRCPGDPVAAYLQLSRDSSASGVSAALAFVVKIALRTRCQSNECYIFTTVCPKLYAFITADKTDLYC